MSGLSDFFSISGGASETSGGGINWSIEDVNRTTADGVGYLMDTTASALTVTLHASPMVGDTVAVGDLKGKFDLNNCTIDRNSMLIQGLADDLVLDVKNQRVTLVYSGATDGWVITELEPNNSQFEYMPYAVMHVREEQPSGTVGTTPGIGTTQARVINQIKSNDIAGASLDGNQITLPAGTYSFAIQCHCFAVNNTKVRLYSVTNASYIAESKSSYSNGAGYETNDVLLQITLTFPSTTVLEIRQYTQTSSSNGLGRPVSQGTEVYLDAVITKIGGNYAPRLITTDARLQMVAGLDYTGNMLGFDISKTGANQLTVSKGTCKDRLGVIDLYLTENTTVAIPAVANTIYHLAVVRLLSGVMTVKAYTSESAMAVDNDIDAFRWIGEWLTNAGTTCVEGVMVNGLMLRGKASECVISTGITTTYATVSHTTQMTPSRVEAIEYGARDATVDGGAIFASIDGINIGYLVGYTSANVIDTNPVIWGKGSTTAQKCSIKPFNVLTQFKSDGGALDLLAQVVQYRR